MNRKLVELILVAMDEASFEHVHMEHMNPACPPLDEALRVTLGPEAYKAWADSGGWELPWGKRWKDVQHELGQGLSTTASHSR